MSEEEKMQALVGQMKLYEAYLNDIDTRESTVARLMEEARLAIEAIQSISGQDPAQTLMPIGIGVYMQTSTSPNNKLLISIGSGVAIEKSKDDAVVYIESRLKELEVALRSMLSQKQEIAARMEQMRAEANAVLQKMQKSG
ncbi:MAG: prefoldin subunit alpha [Nitrososphaerales archaeon]